MSHSTHDPLALRLYRERRINRTRAGWRFAFAAAGLWRVLFAPPPYPNHHYPGRAAW